MRVVNFSDARNSLKSIIDQVSAILIRQSKAYDRATYDAARAQDPTGYLFMGSSMASFPG